MSGWNPLVDGFGDDGFEPFDCTQGDHPEGAQLGKVKAFIADRTRMTNSQDKCAFYHNGHDFGMVNRVDVVRDTSLEFVLTCGCVIILADAIDGAVIEVRK